MTHEDTPDALRRRLEAGETLTGEDSRRLQEYLTSQREQWLATELPGLRQRGDWEGYLALFDSHTRLGALVEIAEDIEDAERYWRCVADVWIGDDAPGLSGFEWRYLFTRVYSVGGVAMMTDAERVTLSTLPDPMTVYRGFTRDGGERGFAWSLDRRQAEWFALWYHEGPRMQRLYGIEPGGTPRVARASVAKVDVIAYLVERNEQEIVALPESVAIGEIVRLSDERTAA